MENQNQNHSAAEGFSSPNMQDLDVLDRIKAGDKSSFEFLYRKYSPFIRHYVYVRVHNQKQTEDLVQDIMLKVWRNLDSYKVDRTFNSWVWGIVKNHVIDHHRKVQRTVLNTAVNLGISCEDLDECGQGVQAVVFENMLEGGDLRADRKLKEKERAAFVKDILTIVNERERRIIEMFYFEEKTYEEMCEEMDMPMGTLKGTLSRAKEKIRSRLAGSGLVEGLLS